MEFFIRTAEGSVPITTQQIAELREQGRLTDDMRCLAIGRGEAWMTYAEVFATLEAMKAAAGGSPAAPSVGCPCPHCLMDVPPESLVCPFCGASLTDCLPDAVLQKMLYEQVVSVDEALANPAYPAEVKRLCGGVSAQFWISLLPTLLLGGLTVFLAALKGDEALLGVPTGISAVLALMCWLVAWSHDFNGNRIATVRSAKVAFTRFFGSLNYRPHKAYAALAPAAWTSGRLPEILFEKIPNRVAQPMSFDDPESFKDYWKSFFKGKSGMTQTVRLSPVKEFNVSDEVVLVQGDARVSSYPSALALLIFLGAIGIVVLVIVIVAMTKRETVPFRKLMLRRGGRWFVLDGMYNGPFDSEQAAELLAGMLSGSSQGIRS